MSAADELVDVIDDDGRTVATVTRREIRQRRLPHRCTYVLVFNRRGDVFVHLRTATKDVYPSYWDVCAGGVLAAGESFDAGARREAAEELGIDVQPEPLFPIRYADAASVAQGMVYRVVHDGPFRLQPEEIVCGEFVPPAEVAVRAAREPFCPDGLLVWAEYVRQTEGGAVMSLPREYRFFTVDQAGDVTLVKFTAAEILDEATVKEIGDQLIELIEQEGRRQMVLNFGAVRLMSSLMLAKLFRLRKVMQGAGGRLALCETNPDLDEVFQALQIPQLFSIYPEEDAAVQSF